MLDLRLLGWTGWKPGFQEWESEGGRYLLSMERYWAAEDRNFLLLISVYGFTDSSLPVSVNEHSK